MFTKPGHAFWLMGLLFFLSSNCFAQGNLMVFPKRIVFEGNKRSEQINLTNIGKDTARYAISLLHYRMKEDGSFEEITTPDSASRFADNYVRFFPRSVVLAPGESQVVRIQQVSAGLQKGEYRSHLYFRAPPEASAKGEEATRDSSFAIRLNPVFGISLPVIIRSGALTALASIGKPELDTSGTSAALKFKIHRTGERSVYGDLLVNCIYPDGKVLKLAEVQGVSVYTPNEVRIVRMRLPVSSLDPYKGCRLHLIYKNRDGQPEVLGEVELPL
ncbi:MAG: hypothetical protein J7502_05555 [Flavisolibacter sp.]|nr:hypothetical protein [Flavisolibacter sp.]